MVKIKQIKNNTAVDGAVILSEGDYPIWSNDSQGSILLPSGPTSARNASGSGASRFNSETGKQEVFDGTTWKNLSYEGATVTASNLGAGEGIYAQTVGDDIQFKSLIGGTNVTLSSDGNSVTIDVASSATFGVEQDDVLVNSSTSTLNFTGVVEVTDAGSGQTNVDILPGVSMTTVTGFDGVTSEPMIMINDTTRGKILSDDTCVITFASNTLTNSDWMAASHVSDADSGIIMPYNATIVRSTGHCENTAANSKTLNVVVDNDTAGMSAIGTLAGGDNVQYVTTGLNIDVPAGSKIRVRANDTGGKIEDTIITLWIKWRA